MSNLPKNLLLIASLTMNAVLGYRLLTDASSPGLPAPPETARAERAADRSVSPRQQLPRTPHDMEAPIPEFTVIDPTLSDYLDYLDLLKGEQLPVEAIRRIMLGSIQEQYAALEARERAATPYWRLAARDDRAWVDQELAWAEEQRQLLTNLFGEEAADDPLFAHLFKPLGDSFSFLSSDKQIALHELLERAQSRTLRQRGQPFVREAIQEQQQAFAAATAAIQELLTPEEFLEYQLRESRLSDSMRRSMDGFDYTEQEFRDIFQLRQEAQFNILGGEPRETETERLRSQISAARDEAEQRVREYLGEDRYEELRKTQDPLFRSLQAIGDRYGRSDAEIDAVYQLTDGYRQQVSTIRGDERLTPDERRDALARINQEMPARIEELVGSEAARSIQQNVNRLLFSPRFQRRGS